MNISNPSAMVDFIIFIKLGESKMTVQYVCVHTLTFYVTDEDGNELLNEDGTTKQFHFEGRLKPLEWLTEDITIDDLTEISDENI